MRRPEPPKRADSAVRSTRLHITMDGAYLRFCAAAQNRKGIDSLAELCRAKLNADPFSGCLFVFRSRRATSIKSVGLRRAGILAGDQAAVQRTLSLVAAGGRTRSRGTYPGAARASSAGAVRGWQPRRGCRSGVAQSISAVIFYLRSETLSGTLPMRWPPSLPEPGHHRRRDSLHPETDSRSS